MSSILLVSPVPTHPTLAGNRARVRTLLTDLKSRGHDVHFMHVEMERGDREEMRAAWGEHYLPVKYTRPVHRFRHLYRRIGRRLGMDTAHTYGIDEWYDAATSIAIADFNRRMKIDTVLVEYVFMSRALQEFSPDVVKVLDTHDIFANRHRRYLQHGENPAWFSCSPREEAKALHRADTILAIQEEEAEDFRARTTRPVVTIGHTVKLNALDSSHIVPGRILAVGSENPINVNSLNWFLAEVFPSVRRRIPLAEVAVAGTICRRLPDPGPGVRLLGELHDLASAYATAQVVLNPMLFGSGLKIKTLEALGHARAVVTTPSGASGLAKGAGEAFRVGSDAAALENEIVMLLGDIDRSAALGEAGFRFARRYNDEIGQGLARVFGETRLSQPDS